MLVTPNPSAFSQPTRLTGCLRKKDVLSHCSTLRKKRDGICKRPISVFINARLISDYKFISGGQGDGSVNKVTCLQAC